MNTVEKGRVVSQEVIDNFGGNRPPGHNNHLETVSLREVRKRICGTLTCHYQQLSPSPEKCQLSFRYLTRAFVGGRFQMAGVGERQVASGNGRNLSGEEG